MVQSKLRRDLLISLSGEAFSKIPLYIFEFLLASWLFVNEYAEWAVIVLFLRAGPYLHLGALSFFNKRYPVLIGRNSTARYLVNRVTNRITNTLFLVYFFLAFILYSLNIINTSMFITWFSLCLLQQYSYFQAKARSDGDFTTFVTGLLIFSFVQLITAYLIVEDFRVLGASLSILCGYSCAVIYYLFSGNNEYSFKLSRILTIKRVLVVGFAPFLLTVSAFLLQVSDRIALILVSNNEMLAFYNFYAIFFQLGITVVNSLGKVLGPYILMISGRTNVQDALKIGEANVYFIFICCFSFSIFFGVLGRELLEVYFSKYSSGMIGIFNYTISGFLLSIALVFYPHLIAAHKEKQIVMVNLLFSFLLVFLIFMLSEYYSNNYFFSIISLTVNGLVSFSFLSMLERYLNTSLFSVKMIVVLLLFLAYLVNFYVWN